MRHCCSYMYYDNCKILLCKIQIPLRDALLSSSSLTYTHLTNRTLLLVKNRQKRPTKIGLNDLVLK